MAASFSIRAVAERTGLSPHVIRAWERRYGAIEPERTAGRHRLYSEAEIERLALLYQAVRGGHSIARVARLPAPELQRLIAAARPRTAATQPDTGDDLAKWLDEALKAVAAFDNGKVEAVLERASVHLGHQGFLRRLAAPLAEEIGKRWRDGDMTAAHEHFLTAKVKLFLGDLTRQFPAAAGAPRIVVATPMGQLHELGALMVASLAANLGWNTIYLGPSLPAEEIAGAVAQSDAAAVALSLVYPEDDAALPNELQKLAGLLPRRARLLVGGRAARAYFDSVIRAGGLYADNLEDLGIQLDSLRTKEAR